MTNYFLWYGFITKKCPAKCILDYDLKKKPWYFWINTVILMHCNTLNGSICFGWIIESLSSTIRRHFNFFDFASCTLYLFVWRVPFLKFFIIMRLLFTTLHINSIHYTLGGVIHEKSKYLSNIILNYLVWVTNNNIHQIKNANFSRVW